MLLYLCEHCTSKASFSVYRNPNGSVVLFSDVNQAGRHICSDADCLLRELKFHECRFVFRVGEGK
jgi:hypothetical protein